VCENSESLSIILDGTGVVIGQLFASNKQFYFENEAKFSEFGKDINQNY